MCGVIPKTPLLALLVATSLCAAPVLESPLFVVQSSGTIQEMRIPPASQVRILDRQGKVFTESIRIPGAGSDLVRWMNLPPGVYRAECVLAEASD